MSGDIGLGRLCDSSAQRDAVHVAVIPAIAGEFLARGTRVFIDKGGLAYIAKYNTQKAIGVVDVFLEKPVNKNERFYVMLFPGTIKSIRHDWTHPELDKVEVKKNTIKDHEAYDRALEWIEDYANSICVRPSELISRAECYLSDGSYWNQGDRFEGEYLPDEFWDHYEIIKGTKVPDGERGSFFTCSC